MFIFILIVVTYIIAFIMYLRLPFYVRLAILAVNSFIPDPIPILDETLMLGSVASTFIGRSKVALKLWEYRRYITKKTIGITVIVAVLFIIFINNL